MKVQSLSNNTLASDNCLCHRNVFRNGVNTFSKIVNHNGSIKCPIEKSIFAVNLALKLYLATGSNADTGSLKSLHTLFNMYLDHMLAKFESNFMVQNVQILSLLTKTEFFKPLFLQSIDAIFQNVSGAKTIVVW